MTVAKKKTAAAKKTAKKKLLSNGEKNMKEAILDHLKYTLAHDPVSATRKDWWICVSMAVRDRLVNRMIQTQKAHHNANTRRLYYLSLEYLMGRMLSNNMISAEVLSETKDALKDLDLKWDDILEEEDDMGLGNGGLGRLAACFLDSLATLDLPAIGYGIYYEFGIFKQEFVNCH